MNYAYAFLTIRIGLLWQKRVIYFFLLFVLAGTISMSLISKDLVHLSHAMGIVDTGSPPPNNVGGGGPWS